METNIIPKTVEEKIKFKEIMSGLNRIEEGLEKVRLMNIINNVVMFYASKGKEAKNVCWKVQKNGDITFY